MSTDQGKEDLKQPITEITEALTMNVNKDRADVARGVASSMGTETPAAVPPDIRDLSGQTLARLGRIEALLEESV